MSPLLTAYDLQIKQLKEQIKIYKQNILEIKNESNKLIKRNEELENELETKIVSLYNNNNGFNDFNEYKQRINILTKHNKLLRESEIRFKNKNYNYIFDDNTENIQLSEKELNNLNK